MTNQSQSHYEERLHKNFPEAKFTIIDFTFSHKPMTIQCDTCGTIRTFGRAEYLLPKKSFCKCEGKTNKLFLSKLKQQNITLIKLADNTNKNSILECSKCHNQFEKSANNAIAKTVVCPYCDGISPAHKYINFEERIEKVFGKNQYQILEENFVQTDKIHIQHKCGFIYSTRINDFLQSQGCPKCAPRLSKGEKRIINYLMEHNLPYEYQSSLPIDNLRFDFQIGDIAIEYQGQQHFFPMGNWGGQEAFEKGQIRDEKKRKYCKENNITLIEIPYTKINEIEIILDQYFGSTTTLNEVAKD